MTWAWEQKVEASSKLVLMALADHADETGVCWPSIARIAEKCGMSQRTVVRHIEDLSGPCGLLKISPRTRADGGQTSNKYSLFVSPPCQIVTPPCQDVIPPLSPVTPAEEPSLEPNKELKPLAQSFARFWTAYPKKRSKGTAERVFNRLNPSEQLQRTILSSLERAKTSEQWLKNKGQFIPYAATWLNAKGWDDEERVEVGGIRPAPRPAALVAMEKPIQATPEGRSSGLADLRKALA